MPIYPPYVIERTSRGERSYDIFSRLLMDRIVFLGSGINDDVANIILAQLLFLDAEDPERDIFMYINSPGGSVYAGMAIYDTMQHLRAPVSTFCVGMAASMGAVLLAAGAEGKRNALPNARYMIHQPSRALPPPRHPPLAEAQHAHRLSQVPRGRMWRGTGPQRAFPLPTRCRFPTADRDTPPEATPHQGRVDAPGAAATAPVRAGWLP